MSMPATAGVRRWIGKWRARDEQSVGRYFKAVYRVDQEIRGGKRKFIPVKPNGQREAGSDNTAG
jgi:hypothetical protein